MSAWQDISTAPRDGSTVIGLGLDYGKPGGARHMALVFWDGDRHDPGFYDRAESVDRYAYLTHWCEVQIPSLSGLPEQAS